MINRVEVVLCTYNGARYLSEQLRSILTQTVAVDRISIYDDRSTDETIAVLGRFVEALPESQQDLFRITVNPANLGYARNFAQAVAQASGEFIFLCDQDDVWEPTKVETLLQLFEADGSDMVFSDGILIDEAGRRIGTNTVLGLLGLSRSRVAQFHKDAGSHLLKRNVINGAAAALRREVAQQALPVPAEIPHDYWFALWCVRRGGISATPHCLYRYRQHAANVIGASVGNLLYDWLGIWRQPDLPRQRELRIWTGVVDRLGALSGDGHRDPMIRKLRWLARVVAPRQQWKRALAIGMSAVRGDYRRYSGGYAIMRDVVSVLRSGSRSRGVESGREPR